MIIKGGMVLDENFKFIDADIKTNGETIEKISGEINGVRNLVSIGVLLEKACMMIAEYKKCYCKR